MKPLKSQEIRQKFLDFFAEKDHQIVPSANLIPINDPTLLWINSGVAALKKYMDGTEVPANPKIANVQKCIRTNDIENVGVTARHHTLFEMLGNWSIGDYFKEEAITWAWEFLTSEKWLNFDSERLYVTYFPEDEETKQIWMEKCGLAENHIVAVEDNFWDIGSGPCGPDSEIFFDRGEKYQNLSDDDPEMYPGGENERYLEIWNLVFSQFNHMPDGSYQPLPNKNVDTGMGLERMASVMQDVPTNFETDLFMPIIKAIGQLTEISYGDHVKTDTSFKVIADHIRAVSFAIGDGALPSNEGRGYILRRLIRRAVMHGRKLGIRRLFISELVPIIAEIMGDSYSELREKESFIKDVLLKEEQRFHETIEEGEVQLNQVIESLRQEGQSTITGQKAFHLYDTFGFPLELTKEMAEEEGLKVDIEGFETAMEAQRERARSARSDAGSMAIQSSTLHAIDYDFDFVGYDQLTTNATIKHIVVNDQEVDQLPAHSEGILFFNRSPFYAEMGGQVADIGGVFDGDQMLAEVLDVQKGPHGQFMHKVKSLEMPINRDQSYTLTVDRQARMRTNQNHTATHLLHKALKEVLGDHANQKGSYVGPDRLRFDFSHFGKMSPEELKQVESYVNFMVENAINVDINEMPIDDAKAMGAMALFGEKYGSIVRVVNVGNESIELCGGTHVNNTNEIGTFKIMAESGIGAGLRRIEALTGQAAIANYQENESLLKEVQHQLKVSQSDQLLHKIEQLQAELKAQQSEIDSLTARVMQDASNEIFEEVQTVNDMSYIAASVDNQNMDSLRALGDTWQEKAASNILVLATSQEDKANLLVLVDQETVAKGIKAGDLIKPLAKYIQGGGGGRPTMAQAGGKNPAGIQQLLASVADEIKNLLA
ncbi:alanine--tRNA ligase [Facklamia miroungae]|uniref:Alanine--tRNA ligase n=1 Tax=Facklamia miroungae TaxID=120956 RepID=A0A1G7V701_9LACT|nr:alanine--tRNA ligase [Facklamia miroungae]NKZ30254.1 alanine--tRNA ligase [Facklamia miroungae]SDG55281.1 alanyl-tRNA synthetase [Facklamia miroungae]